MRAINENHNDYELSSGRAFYANGHIIGLAPKDEYGWAITEGYDGSVQYDVLNSIDDPDEDPEDRFSKADLVEIADYMIEMWGEFRRDVSNHKEALGDEG